MVEKFWRDDVSEFRKNKSAFFESEKNRHPFFFVNYYTKVVNGCGDAVSMPFTLLTCDPPAPLPPGGITVAPWGVEGEDDDLAFACALAASASAFAAAAFAFAARSSCSGAGIAYGGTNLSHHHFIKIARIVEISTSDSSFLAVSKRNLTTKR